VRLAMLYLAFRNLFRHKIRLLIAVGGIALALVLILALDAIVTGIEDQFTTYIDNSGADIFVAQEGIRNLHMVSSALPDLIVAQVKQVPGVETVTPILYISTTLDTGKDSHLVYLIGLPPTATAGKPWRIAAGIAIPEAGQIVVDSDMAKRDNLKLGDTIKVFGQPFKIAGLSEKTANLLNAIAFISLADFARLRGSTNTVSFVLTTIKSGQLAQAVAGQIEQQVPGVTALARSDFADQERKVVIDMSADIINIMNLVGFLIGLTVMALTIYTATISLRTEYGLLKSVGAHNSHLYRVVLYQATANTLLGFALALLITFLLALAVPFFNSRLTLEITFVSLLKVGLLSLVIAAISAVLPIRQIAKLDPTKVFSGGKV